MDWKQCLSEARAYQKKGMTLLYKRTRSLMAAFESEDFRTHCRQINRSPESFLDDEVGDLCCKFRILRSVFLANPDEHQWRNRRLEEMVAERIVAAKQRDGETSPRVNWRKKYEELSEMYDELREKHAAQERELFALRRQFSQINTMDLVNV